MLAIERRNQILTKLHTDKKVLVGELSQAYKVSEETIRRDLDKLEKQGVITKSYGGAVLNENNIDLPFNVRKNFNIGAKQMIAEIIAENVLDGESIMLDSSSTAVFVAKALKEKKNLTIITNSIEILIRISEQKSWNVLSTGGILNGSSLDFVGPMSNKMITSFHVDKAIISCKGIDMEIGLTDSNIMQAEIKRTMLACAREKILVLDSSKFNQKSFTQIGDVKEVTTIVTEECPNPQWVDYFNQNHVECIYPSEEVSE